MAPVSGQLATNHSTFAGGAGPALDTLAGNDRALSTQLDEAARSDRTGRTSPAPSSTAPRPDTNGLAPFTNTPPARKHSWSPCASASPNNNKSCRPTKPAVPAWPRCCGRWPTAVAHRWAAGRRSVVAEPGWWHVDGLFPGGDARFRYGADGQNGERDGSAAGITAPQRRPVLRTQRYPVGAGGGEHPAAINRALDLKGSPIRGPSVLGERDDGGVGSGSRATIRMRRTTQIATPPRNSSQGAFQFIEPTFRAYHEPGTSTNLARPSGPGRGVRQLRHGPVQRFS